MSRSYFLSAVCPYCTCLLFIAQPVFAGEEAPQAASPNLYGVLGLNTVPSARMDKPGTVRAGVSTLDPYAHAWMGIQIAKPLSIVLRQSAEISSVSEEATALYPGLDLKLRLNQESAAWPEIALGFQSAFGHKRMAAEYLVLSKRYHEFDISGGLGWGALSQSADLRNPFHPLGHDFNHARPSDGETPNSAGDWWTGKDISAFGGVEYFTPIDGLSMKLDYSSLRYNAEKETSDFSAPAPWGVGLNYKPRPWIDLALGTQGADKIMARLSLQTTLQDWRDQDEGYRAATPLHPHRTDLTLPAQMQNDASGQGVLLFDTRTEEQNANAKLMFSEERSLPSQLREASVHLANNAGKNIEQLSIEPMILGLQGPKIKLLRKDLERSLGRREGSAEEIWQHTEFDSVYDTGGPIDIRRPSSYGYGFSDFSFQLDNRLSLTEEDSGTLYRSSLLVKHKAPGFFGLLDNFAGVRLNLKNNLDGLYAARTISAPSVRADIEFFAQRRIAVDTLFSAYTHSLRPNLHLALMGGYLEEMYAGAGGEILYRPFESRFALGAESWLTLKRDPFSPLNTGIGGERILSGHLNAWYQIPDWNTAFKASVGRYLAGDIGTTLGFESSFTNGVKLKSGLTLTNKEDPDPLGGNTNKTYGLQLVMPLGGFEYMPRHASVKLAAEPLGRQSGQRLENPLSLYDITEPFTLQHMQDHWDKITP